MPAAGAAVPAVAEGAGQLEDLDEPPEPRVRGSGRAGLMKPLVVLALPGMYLFYKYSQYRREQRELSRRRVTERELQHLHHKIVSEYLVVCLLNFCLPAKNLHARCVLRESFVSPHYPTCCYVIGSNLLLAANQNKVIILTIHICTYLLMLALNVSDIIFTLRKQVAPNRSYELMSKKKRINGSRK